MPRRVDVDDALPPVTIPGPVLNDICNHARDAAPVEECCGLVLGPEPGVHTRVVRCRNDMNRLHADDPDQYPTHGAEAFWMNPAEYQRIAESAEDEGEQVTAVYHSHINCGAYLSETDLLFAEQPGFPFPEAAHIVVAVAASARERTVTEVALFRREAPGRPFAGHRVESFVP